MEKHAYCAECRRYVALAGETCPAGHGGDSLRDVRSGPLPAEFANRPRAGGDASISVASSGGPGRPTTATKPDSAETAGRIVGWLVVLIPSLLFGALMVGLTEPQFEGMGMSTGGAWFASLVSVALTLGVALAWGWLKLVRKRR